MHVRPLQLPLGLQCMALFALVAILVPCMGGSVTPSFEVHRLSQIDVDGKPFGSRKTAFNLLAAPSSFPGDLSRRVVVLPFADANPKTLGDILDTRKAGALLIVLPTVDELDDDNLARWKEVEDTLVSAERPVPIYFTFNEADVRDLISRLSNTESSEEEFRLVVTSPEATKVTSIPSSNFQGWLAGSGGSQSLAVLAHYDTFAAAPSLATGADSNGSGVIALLELARLFRKLYDGPRTQGSTNLLFVLTGAGHQDYAGAKHWLQESDLRLLESIEAAICLDSIGGGDSLTMHVSKLPKAGTNAAKLHASFKQVAERMGIPFKIAHKKVNIGNTAVPWEHEQFPRTRPALRIPAATISRHADDSRTRRNSLFDNKLDQAVLKRNIRFIGESLASHIFGLDSSSAEVFRGSLDVNDALVASWSDLLSKSPRVTPYMPKKSPVIDGLNRLLKNYTVESTKQSFKVDSGHSFYVNSDVTTMSAFTVKPLMFDVIMSLCIAAYSLAILVGLEGFGGAMSTLKSAIIGSGHHRRKAKK